MSEHQSKEELAARKRAREEATQVPKGPTRNREEQPTRHRDQTKEKTQ